MYINSPIILVFLILQEALEEPSSSDEEDL